ncbi:MAG: hypothetical protein GWN30_05210 [Gammaproteobacteria bacterium]|nr:hypothetical protein [Gammaproteobacteria bacterium]
MDMNTAGGLAAIVMGLNLLTTPYWTGPSHTYQGENWVNLLQVELNISGILLVVGGIALLVQAIVDILRRTYAYARLGVPKDS